MFKFIIVFSLLFGNSFAEVPKEQNIINISNEHVKQIFTADGGWCSSVVLEYKSHIRQVTNAHCCKVPMFRNNSFVEFIKIDTKKDLCEFTTKVLPLSGIKLSERTVNFNQTTYVAGFPDGFHGRLITKGVVTGFYVKGINETNPKIPPTYLDTVSNFVAGGNSGGAAMNEDGELIGIIAQRDSFYTGRYIPLPVLRFFLDNLPISHLASK